MYVQAQPDGIDLKFYLLSPHTTFAKSGRTSKHRAPANLLVHTDL
jgi:hypothetical protein